MNAEEGRGVRWESLALGWMIAATAVVLALALGFLAYLLGGFTVGRSSGHSGALNGAMAAVLGLVLGLAESAVLAPLDAVFAWGVAAPPANSGPSRAALVAGLLLYFSDLFGGYVGGELGEPTRPEVRHFG